MQSVDNDHKNNLTKFEKVRHSIVLSIWIIRWALMPIEINTDLYFTENWESEISKTLHTVLNLIVIQML